MAIEDDIAFLDCVPTLHILGREVLRILAISTESLHIRGGENLFEEGEPADGGYVVLDGAIMLQSVRDRAAGEAVVARPGTLIGEMALIVETSRPATATAMESSTVLRVPRTVFLRILEGEPGAAETLRRMISQRVETTIGELDLVLPLFEGSDGPREPDLR